MLRRDSCAPRRGTVLPLFCLCVVGLFGCIALAIDLGLLAVARTECQNAADAAALAGTRQLNNVDGADSNKVAAVEQATITPTYNQLYNATFGMASEVKLGVYEYNATPGVEQFVPDFNKVPGRGQSYTAMRVTVQARQPAYFSGIFSLIGGSVGQLETNARAVAVHRPRDIAMVLDATGSMRFGTTLCFANNYLSADPSYPKFGPYARYAAYANSSPNASSTGATNPADRHNPYFTTREVDLGVDGAHAPSNYTVPTRGGPACVKDFYFDPANLATPANPISSPSGGLVTQGDTTMRRAFHHWTPPESGGNPDAYIAPTYGFGNWNTTKNLGGYVLYPTPYGFEDQSDANYLGDRHARKWGKENGTGAVALNTSWDPLTADGAATSAAEYLRWVDPITSGASTPRPNAATPPGVRGSPAGRTFNNFRDGTWEKHGYDLDVGKYITDRGTRDPRTPLANAPLRDADRRFKGYSMGPGYWGKTFFQWPPDPRYGPELPAVAAGVDIPALPLGTVADPTAISTTNPVQDTSGRWICDWRRRFFLDKNSQPFNPQGDSNPDEGGVQGIDETLLGINGQLIKNYNNQVKVNYDAVLKWLKSPPMALPPNLRAGRVVYYTSIPDSINSGPAADRAFWRAYIDYVLNPPDTDASVNRRESRAWPEGATAELATTDPEAYDRDGTGGPFLPDPKPYQNYLDNPSRPRAQAWFGPITMLAFLAEARGNTWAGTVHESQTWQLKAGMSSVLSDIRSNHPNDAVGLAYFSSGAYGRVAVALGQEWTPLNDALFYPQSLVDAGTLVTPTIEFAAYDTNANNRCGSQVPNAQGGTDPNTGLAMAFNILTPSTQANIRGPATLPTPYFGQNRPQAGRRGASKIVLFETDGVPNRTSDVSVMSGGGATYYKVDNINGSGTSSADALEVVNQMVKNLADGGLSSDTSPARVYSIGFGDLFDSASSGQVAARSFLLDVQKAGKTSAATDSAIPPSQIITGPAQTRIDSLTNCLERIMQSGVQVTLIE